MARRTIPDLLAPQETILWEGTPAPGRGVARNGWIWLGAMVLTALTFFMAALGLMTIVPAGSSFALAPYVLVVLAAVATFIGLNVTLLERRRARARDRVTRFAITNQRALSLVGPYDFALSLCPTTQIEYRDEALAALILRNEGGDALSFDRLNDGARAHDIMTAQIAALKTKASP